MKITFTPIALGLMLGMATGAGAQSWGVTGGDSGNTRYSEAKQVNTGNVNKLKVEWALQLGSLRSQESTPILVGDTLYLTSPRPSVRRTLSRSTPRPAKSSGLIRLKSRRASTSSRAAT